MKISIDDIINLLFQIGFTEMKSQTITRSFVYKNYRINIFSGIIIMFHDMDIIIDENNSKYDEEKISSIITKLKKIFKTEMRKKIIKDLLNG